MADTPCRLTAFPSSKATAAQIGSEILAMTSVQARRTGTTGAPAKMHLMVNAVADKGRYIRIPLSVLILTRGSAETDKLLQEFEDRIDLWIVRVPSLQAGVAAMRFALVALVIIAPEIPPDDVSVVLGEVSRLGRHTPVLLLRSETAETQPAWKSHSMAVLRSPLAPGILSRAVDLALQPVRTNRARRLPN
jgi:hypothetical protein